MESLKGYLKLLKNITEGLAIAFLIFPNLYTGIESKVIPLICTYVVFVRIVMMDSVAVKEYKLRIACDMITRRNVFYIYLSSIIKFLAILSMTVLNCYIIHHIIWTILDILTK